MNRHIFFSRLAQTFGLTGFPRACFLFLLLPLATTVFADPAPSSNSLPWSCDFEDPPYVNGTFLIDGTNGWYSSPGVYDTNLPPQTSVVQNVHVNSGSQAAEVAIGDTLESRFVSTSERVVRLEMFVQPQLWTSSVYPSLTSPNVAYPAAQFLVNSNGYFVVANGTNWSVVTSKGDGTAIPITNNYFTKIQVNLCYRNHTWSLKAWTNDTDVVAISPYVNFTSNLNAFSGFCVYGGTTNCYLDDLIVTNINYTLLPKVNGVPRDDIKSINGAPPSSLINGI